MVVLAVLALFFVADGVPDHVRPAHDPSGGVAAVQSGPLASIATLRRQTSVGDGRFRTDSAGGSRGAALLALVSVLCLLGLGSGTAHRAEHPTWAGCARRRHGISLRAPPLAA